MKLERSQVQHIATLARVGMTEAELERFRDQLSNILDQFEVLKQVDVTGVEPTTQVQETGSVFREDKSRPSLSPDEALSNAPRAEDGAFRVLAVLGDE